MPNLVPMQLARIIKSDISENQVIYLKEVDGERQFPILIGYFEATSIDLRVTHAERPARPLTHDLIVGVAQSLGATIESVVVAELKDEVYYASLRLKRDEETIDVDARPSDAIAVAVSFQPPLPILVAEDIVERLAP
ncbi:MAG: bifunctional nuclease family protein [Planctomycetes bacterium]|nr:bifunctional nuclease family protein [Planctomycetota bacterium]